MQNELRYKIEFVEQQDVLVVHAYFNEMEHSWRISPHVPFGCTIPTSSVLSLAVDYSTTTLSTTINVCIAHWITNVCIFAEYRMQRPFFHAANNTRNQVSGFLSGELYPQLMKYTKFRLGEGVNHVGQPIFKYIGITRITPHAIH